MSHRRARLRAGLAVAAVCCLAVTGCEASDADQGPGGKGTVTSETVPVPGTSQGRAAGIRLNLDGRATNVAVDTILDVEATDGVLSAVTVAGEGEGLLRGSIEQGGRFWRASDRLEPGVTYVVEAEVKGADGVPVTKVRRFATEALPLERQTYASVAPRPGETVGVGMPVIVSFDVPVTDRASIEQRLSVVTRPAQDGSWSWLSDREVHYRPKRYWRPGTQVSVDVDINSVSAGGGVYGQESRHVDFTVGDAHIYKVDMDTHQMSVLSNGELLRRIPITTGEQPKFTTRSGVKVIIEKFASRRMNSETVGIPAGSPDAYDIDDVRWAMRLTYSGEFIHAAPWSVGSQGYANVSHGCTGMSTDNADWLYHLSRRGDVVEYVGSDRTMEPGNGFSEWNLSWAKWQKGSALN